MLTPIQIDPEVKKLLQQPLSPEIVKQRDSGGGRMISFITGSTCVDLLNRIFNYKWDWRIQSATVQPSVPFYNRSTKQLEEQNPVAHVHGILTVYLQDENGKEVAITKSGYGSHRIIGKQSEQESVFKSASTDALKKAASLLGIGIELQRDASERAFFRKLNAPKYWEDKQLREKYKPQLDYIAQVKQQMKWTDDQLDYAVQYWSKQEIANLQSLPPESIDDFTAYLKSGVEGK